MIIRGQVSGVALLNILIGVSHIIRNELSSLDLYPPQVGYDIETLNEHIWHLMVGLEALG
jgi:hypothetical protein